MKTYLKLASVLVLGLQFGQAWAQTNPGATLSATFSCTAADDAVSTYEIWEYSGSADTTWAAAQAFAEARPTLGNPGHLATFRDVFEENCVLAEARDLGLGNNQQLWIGLFQNNPAPEDEPDGLWGWITGEPLSYINWADGEPNNSGSEDFATIGRYGYAEEPDLASGWNDELETRNSLRGFVVEFDDTSDITGCLEDNDEIPEGEIGIGGCVFGPGGSQIVELPNALGGLPPETLETLIIAQTGTPAILTSSVCDGEFVGQDPRVDIDGNVIDHRILDLSEVFDIPPGVAHARADTVGSPCLALIIGEANFDFSDLVDVLPNGGVYTTTQRPENVPDMFTIPEVGPLDEQPDLQFVPQASFQSHDKFLIVEEAASPFTNEVFNPSRKKTFEFSYFLLNTREVCLGLPSHLDPSDGFWYYKAVLLCKAVKTGEYFHNLDETLDRAAAEGNLNSPRLRALKRDFNAAWFYFAIGWWSRAESKLMDFEADVLAADWNVDERNDPGNVQMRIANLKWRIDQLQQAAADLYSF